MSGSIRVFDYQGNSEVYVADSARVEGGILYLVRGMAVTIVNADAWSKAVATEVDNLAGGYAGVNNLRGGYI